MHFIETIGSLSHKVKLLFKLFRTLMREGEERKREGRGGGGGERSLKCNSTTSCPPHHSNRKTGVQEVEFKQQKLTSYPSATNTSSPSRHSWEGPVMVTCLQQAVCVPSGCTDPLQLFKPRTFFFQLPKQSQQISGPDLPLWNVTVRLGQ